MKSSSVVAIPNVSPPSPTSKLASTSKHPTITKTSPSKTSPTKTLSDFDVRVQLRQAQLRGSPNKEAAENCNSVSTLKVPNGNAITPTSSSPKSRSRTKMKVVENG